MRKSPIMIAAAAVVLIASHDGIAGAGKSLKATRAEQPIVIDGALSEPAWRTAEQGSLQPKEGSAQAARFRVLYDDQALYIGMECDEPTPEKIVAAHKERDSSVWEDDDVEIFLDTRCDRKSYYHICINAAGVQADEGRSPSGESIAWNGPWEAKTKIGTNQWTVEIRLPLKSLEVGLDTSNKWGLNVCRCRGPRETREFTTWCGGFHKPQEWGDLEGLSVDFAGIAARDYGVLTNGGFEHGLDGWQTEGSVELGEGQREKGVILGKKDGLSTLVKGFEWIPCRYGKAELAFSIKPMGKAKYTLDVEFNDGRKMELSSGKEKSSWKKDEYRVGLPVPTPDQWNRVKVDLNEPFIGQGTFPQETRLSVKKLALRCTKGTLAADEFCLKGQGIGFDIPVPNYLMNVLEKQLAPSLTWIARERLRIYEGWPMEAQPRARKGKRHSVNEYIQKAVAARFNIIASGANAFWTSPYPFYFGKTAALEIRRLGARPAWDGSYVFAAGQARNRDLRPFVDKTGRRDIERQPGTPEHMMTAKDIPCYRDERFWKRGLEEPALQVVRWAESTGIPNLVQVYLLDLEMLGEGHTCYCKDCFASFLKSRNIELSESVPADKRHYFLLSRVLVGEFEQWQKMEVQKILERIRDRIHAEDPDIIFWFYPYHCWQWLHQAVLAGLGAPQVPCIGMNDTMYWTGYSGNPANVINHIQEARRQLGYEPFCLPSIDYYTTPKYPSYTPQKAGQELYLMARAAPGAIIFGESRGGDMWQEHAPYWPEFEKAVRYLKEDGVIRDIDPALPSKEVLDRIASVRKKLDEEISALWLKEGGAPFYCSDPTQQEQTKGTGLRLVKDLDGCDGKDFIYNGTIARYAFAIPEPGKWQKVHLTLNGSSAVPKERCRMLVRINGKTIGVIKGPVPQGPFAEWRLEIPPETLKAATTVEIGFFNGEDFFQTYFDTNLFVDWIALELEP